MCADRGQEDWKEENADTYVSWCTLLSPAWSDSPFPKKQLKKVPHGKNKPLTYGLAVSDWGTQSLFFLESLKELPYEGANEHKHFLLVHLRFFFLKGYYKIREKWAGCRVTNGMSWHAPSSPPQQGNSDQDLWPVKPLTQLEVCQSSALFLNLPWSTGKSSNVVVYKSSTVYCLLFA